MYASPCEPIYEFSFLIAHRLVGQITLYAHYMLVHSLSFNWFGGLYGWEKVHKTRTQVVLEIFVLQLSIAAQVNN